MKSRHNNRSLSLFALTETVSVFNRVLRGMNLQFRLILEKMSTIRHAHNTVNFKILAISILNSDTNGSGLIKEGDGDTHIHIVTYKNKAKVNTNFAFMYRYEHKEIQGGLNRMFVFE